MMGQERQPDQQLTELQKQDLVSISKNFFARYNGDPPRGWKIMDVSNLKLFASNEQQGLFIKVYSYKRWVDELFSAFQILQNATSLNSTEGGNILFPFEKCEKALIFPFVNIVMNETMPWDNLPSDVSSNLQSASFGIAPLSLSGILQRYTDKTGKIWWADVIDDSPGTMSGFFGYPREV
jgi:hypothetical protein